MNASPSRASSVTLRMILSWLFSVFLAAAGVSSLNYARTPSALLPKAVQYEFAFASFSGPPAARAPGSSRGAFGPFSSFFRSHKASSGAAQSQQQQPTHTELDLYRLMGLKADASPAAVAARAQALQQQLSELSEAQPAAADPLLSSLLDLVASTLQDPQQRAAYDKEGVIPASLSALLSQLPAASPAASASEGEEEQTAAADEETAAGDASEDDADGRASGDPFSALFGGDLFGESLSSQRKLVSSGRGAPRSQQGEDIEARVTLGFSAAALQGAPALPLTVQRLEACDKCNGTGGARGSKPTLCKSCEGKGVKTETRRSSFAVLSTSMTCAACGGQGHLPPPRCGSCGGHGREPRNVTLEVSVPPGVSTGSLLEVEGQGSAGIHGGAPGNLYVTVEVESDSRFTRQGVDVHSEETVSLADAALGATKVIQVIDGEAELTIPPNSQPGQQLVLKGRGARVLGDASAARGDHVVTLRVALPDKVSEEEKRLLQRLQELQRGVNGKTVSGSTEQSSSDRQ